MNKKIRKVWGIIYLVLYILIVLSIISISIFGKELNLYSTPQQLSIYLSIIFFIFTVISVIFFSLIRKR